MSAFLPFVLDRGFFSRGRLSTAAVLASLVAAAIAAGPGCGSGSGASGFGDDASVPDAGATGDAGPLDGLVSLEVTPADASLRAGDTTTSQAFTARGRFTDGSSRDVTSLVAWSAFPTALLTASGPRVTPTGVGGGDGTVSAVSGSVTGTAKVHVAFAKTVLAAGAPPGSDTKLGGPPATALAATLLYPLDGALFPPNLGPMEIQWRPAPGTTLFDVDMVAAALDLHVITPCNAVLDGCALTPDAATWAAIVATLQGSDPVAVTVRATDDQGTGVGTSAPVSVQFAQTEIKGGLYYFNTRGQTFDGGSTGAGIYRYDFEKALFGAFFTQGQCAGCHAMSLDGTKMLAPICTNARGCGRPLQLAVVDVATKTFVTPPYPVGDSDTQTWSPDNKYYVTTPSCAAIPGDPSKSCDGAFSGGVLNLVDAATNTFVNKVPTGAAAMYPSFSTSGKKLVYARAKKYNAPLSVLESGLFTIDFNAGQWGTEASLLPSVGGQNNYYPSFSPDDQWVLFTRSKCDAGEGDGLCDTYDDPSSRAFVVPAAGGAAVDLARANGTGKLDNSWARWSPFKGTYKGGDVLWLTFSSVRDYGLRVVKPAQGEHVRQLWLVGFDTARARSGLDPSFAPVWLPFQDVLASNHIAQWTTKVVGSVK